MQLEASRPIQSLRWYNGLLIALGIFALYLLLNEVPYHYRWRYGQWDRYLLPALIALVAGFKTNWRLGLAVGLGVFGSEHAWITLREMFDSSPDSVATFRPMPTFWPALIALGCWTIAYLLLRLFSGRNAQTASTQIVSHLPYGLFIAALVLLNLVFYGYVRADCTLIDPIRRQAGCIRAWQIPGANKIAVSAESGLIAIGTYEDTIEIRRSSDGSIVSTIAKAKGFITDLAISANGQTLVGESTIDSIRVWRVNDGTLLHTFAAEGESVILDVDVTADGQFVAATYVNESVRVWRVSDGTLVHELRQTRPSDVVAFSPDGKLLASVEPQKINLWDLATGQIIRTIAIPAWIDERLVFSPDGRFIAVTGNAVRYAVDVRIFSTADGSQVHSLPTGVEEISSIAFSPDSTRIAAVPDFAEDDTIKIWSVADGSLIQSVDPGSASAEVAFLGNSHTLVVEGAAIYFWRVS